METAHATATPQQTSAKTTEKQPPPGHEGNNGQEGFIAACGPLHDFRKVAVEPIIPRVDNRYEDEAAQAGKTIVSQKDTLQEPGHHLSKTAAPQNMPLAPSIQQALRSPGIPLPSYVRTRMEKRFNHNFNRVRVHADTAAAGSATVINANAYTINNHIVFNKGKYAPGTASGDQLIAHELTHVMQQEGGDSIIMRQHAPEEDPRSLSEGLNPAGLSDDELRHEIRLIRAWLDRQTTGTAETDRLMQVLQQLQHVRETRRARSTAGEGDVPVPPVPASGSGTPLLPATSSATVPSSSTAAPVTTTVTGSSTPPVASTGRSPITFTPSAATQQRLMEILTNGGPIPTESTARVIGAAIVEVEGFRGHREIRAISSRETDAIGRDAPVFHATTPTTRTLSAPLTIGGRSGDFPGAHTNDAEQKMFEYIIANMPPGARGRISFVTMRSRDGGRILEPIAACSGCTAATFQLAGTVPAVEVATYAPARPIRTLDFSSGGSSGSTPPVAPRTGAGPVTSGGGSASTRSASSGTLTAEVGTPDMSLPVTGGPSARGEAIGAGITLAFMGLNILLNAINDHIQEQRVREELNRIEPGIRTQRQQRPGLGVLLVFFYTQVEAPPESLIRPGAVFGHIEYYTGQTRDEARENRTATPAIRAGTGPGSNEITQEVWIPPLVEPAVSAIRTPFPGVASATFASGHNELQDVRWNGVLGFDDEGTSTLSPAAGQTPRFIVLRVPSIIHFFNGPAEVDVNIPVEERAAHAGGNIPAVQLDTTLPFDTPATCIFPADDATDQLFAGARATHDNLGQLTRYTHFRKARWVLPQYVDVTQRI